jgi:hypothetical protein
MSTNVKDMDERMEWGYLPPELLPTIGKCLDTRIDVLRFRSVCNSWRSSIPPSLPFNSPCFPHPYPYRLYPVELLSSKRATAYLCESTIYSLQSLNPSTPDEGFLLIKDEDSNSGKLRRLDGHRNWYKMKSLNLLDFRVLEVTKVYTLKCQYPRLNINKVLKFPNSARTNVNDCAVLFVYTNGKLGFAKCGDEKYTLIGDLGIGYDDIIVYKGQFYVVDSLGIIWWIRSSLKLVKFSPQLCGLNLGFRKHLVESCGALYVVDRYKDRKCLPKVYKLDEEQGRWDLEKSLGDRAFVLGLDGCFSVSAEEFSGYKRNCIYFVFQFETFVYHLEEHQEETNQGTKLSNKYRILNFNS